MLKNFRFITSVRPIVHDIYKTAKINFINSGVVDIIRTVYYIHRPELMKLFLPFYMCHERWVLHLLYKTLSYRRETALQGAL